MSQSFPIEQMPIHHSCEVYGALQRACKADTENPICGQCLNFCPLSFPNNGQTDLAPPANAIFDSTDLSGCTKSSLAGWHQHDTSDKQTSGVLAKPAPLSTTGSGGSPSS